MSTQVTITLSDEVYQKADRFARLANQDIASVLANTLQSSLPEMSLATTTLESISLLSDADVLALTQLQMEPDQDSQLSELLNHQQAGTLIDSDRTELQILMQTYQEGLLRKATALSEAVKRKLLPPLNQ